MSNTSSNEKDINRELQEIMRHAEALLNATAEDVDDRVKQARAKLDERLAEAKRKFGSVGDDMRETVELTDRFIHDKPYHAIGGSFLIGLLLGWLMRGK